MTTLATMVAASTGVESRPSETMSVVAHAGAWFASVAIIPQLVSAMETTPLAASLKPSGDSAAGALVSETPSARSAYANRPATAPTRCPATIRWVAVRPVDRTRG